MWQGKDAWLNYVKNIIAADVSSAIFLAGYLRRINVNKNCTASLEIIDLHRYRVITNRKKVFAAINKGINKPFVFLVGRN